MKKLVYLVICSSFLGSSVFAQSYVKCGTDVDLDTMEVTGYELEMSSDNDDYSGPVGENWNLKLDENGDWLSPRRNVLARSLQDSNQRTLVEITISKGATATGAVGTVYKLIDLYSEEPVLEKYTMGGFAGTVKLGTFKCLSGND